MTGRVLVAGVGNIFLGDDAFGVEVVRRLDPTALPAHVDVADYGIRGVHLAYDLLDGRHRTLVLVDAVPLDEPPGTLAVLDVSEAVSAGDDPGAAATDMVGAPALDAHGMSPAAVLHLLRSLAAPVARVLVVACHPARVGEAMEMSPEVAAAVDRAVPLVVDVVLEEVAARA